MRYAHIFLRTCGKGKKIEKYYNHHHVSAIGSCIICNKNLCELCAYIINGKIYCKTHADEILIKKTLLKKIYSKINIQLLFLIGIIGITLIIYIFLPSIEI